MRKICSITLAMLLLLGAIFVAPAVIAETTTPAYEVTADVDFDEACYLTTDASRFQWNAVVTSIEGRGNVAQLQRLGGNSGNYRKQNGKIGIVNADASDYFLAKAGVTYSLSFEYNAPVVAGGNLYLSPLPTTHAFRDTDGAIGNCDAVGSIALVALSENEEWQSYTGTFKFEEDTWLILEMFNPNSSSLTKSQQVNIDNIVISAYVDVNYGDGTVSVPRGSTYEEARAKIPYATALYLDAAKTQEATGVINATGFETTVYPAYQFESVDVDFDETAYLTTDASRFQWNALVTDLTETDSEHGNVMKITRVGGGSGNALKQNAKVGIVNANASDYFVAKAGIKYSISFEYNIPASVATGNLYLSPLPTTHSFTSGNIGNCNYDGSIQLVALSKDAAWKTYTGTFQFNEDTWLVLEAFNPDAGSSTSTDLKKNQTIYVDNIAINPVATVTLPGGSTLEVNPNANIETLLPAPENQYSLGYFFDEACTKPATGKLDSLNVTLYSSKVYYGADVDFEESIYTSKDNVNRGELVADPLGINGTSMKFDRINGNGFSGNATKYNNCFAFANNSETGRFAFEAGATYRFTYDIYKKTLSEGVKALGAEGTKASIYFDFASATGKASAYGSEVLTLDQWIAYEDLVETAGWETHTAIVTIPADAVDTYAFMFIRVPGASRYDDNEIYFDNIKIEKMFATAPGMGGIFSAEHTEANAAAGIEAVEGSAVYTVNGVEYTAIRAFAQYIAPAKQDGTADYGKILKADGTTADIASRHVLLGYGARPTLNDYYAKSTATAENLDKCWTATDNGDGTFTVTYSLLLKKIPEKYAGIEFEVGGAIVTKDGETITTNRGPDISAKIVYNEAIKANPELKWFGGATGTVE